jgi:hypothetical protein
MTPTFIEILASVFRPALGPTEPPVQWVPGVLSPGLKRGRRVTLTTHSHLVPSSRMSMRYTASHPKRLHGVQWDSIIFELLLKSLNPCGKPGMYYKPLYWRQ